MHCMDGLPHGANEPEACGYIVYKVLGPLTVDLLPNPIPHSAGYGLGAVSMYECVSDALESTDGVAAHPLFDKIEGIGLQESRSSMRTPSIRSNGRSVVSNCHHGRLPQFRRSHKGRNSEASFVSAYSRRSPGQTPSYPSTRCTTIFPNASFSTYAHGVFGSCVKTVSHFSGTA